MDEMLGSIAGLWRYPVKALAAEVLAVAEVDAEGFVGDRATALLGRAPDRPRAGKPVRGKEIGRLHLACGLEAGEETARAAGWEVEPGFEGPYFDAQPVALLRTGWLSALEARLGRRIDPLRFRANVLIADRGDEAPPPEASLVGRTLRLGTVVLRVRAPITRCVVPTRDLATGVPDADVQHVLVAERGNIFGVYASVVQPGRIAVGDDVVARAAG